MPTFSARSKLNLGTCHPDLQRLFAEVIKHVDCAVLCGHRSKADQDRALAEGKSKLSWPKSKHNKTPSLAADVVPYPINWGDVAAFDALAVIVKDCAMRLGIKIAWGGDWTSFKDRPHYELAG